MENENEIPGKKSPEELEELKKQNEQSEEIQAKSEGNSVTEKDDNQVNVTREHDFTHTHPTHARHKRFGADHEPGTF